jgi:hypothetical protein
MPRRNGQIETPRQRLRSHAVKEATSLLRLGAKEEDVRDALSGNPIYRMLFVTPKEIQSVMAAASGLAKGRQKD